MASFIGATIALLFLICWSLIVCFHIRYFNRTVYSHCSLGLNSAVGMWGGRFNKRHYLLVTIDSTDCIVAVAHYDTSAKKSRFHVLTHWHGVSLKTLVRELESIDRSVNYAFMRAICLLHAHSSSHNIAFVKVAPIEYVFSSSTKSDELSAFAGYIIAPNIASELAHNFIRTTTSD